MSLIFHDWEWDYRTGEPLVGAVAVDNERPKIIWFKDGLATERLTLSGEAFYKSTPNDVRLFQMAIDGDVRHHNVDMLRKLTDNYSGVFLPSQSLGGMYEAACKAWGIPSKLLNERSEDHLYTSEEIDSKAGRARIKKDVTIDVKMLRLAVKHQLALWERHKNKQPRVLNQYAEDTLNYLSQHRPIHMNPTYIDALNKRANLDLLEEKLRELGFTAFSVGTSPKTGFLTIKWNVGKWTDHDVPEVLKLDTTLNYVHKGTLKKRSRFHIDDFDPNASYKLRDLENIEADFRVPLYLVGVVRTQRYHYYDVNPFIIPHGASSGRSTHRVDPINSGLLCRSNVLPSTGWTVLSVDLQSQEPMLAAMLSHDEHLWQCIQAGDVYMEFARLLGNSKEYCERVLTKGTDERDYIKVTFLQYLYGAGAGRLMTTWHLDRAMQDKQMRILKECFPDFEAWRSRVIGAASWDGYVELPNEYRLHVDGRQNPRQTVNALIQGRGAVGMQEWLRYLRPRLVGGAYVMCELYDGLYVHTPLEAADENSRILLESKKAWQSLYPEVKQDWTAVLQGDFSGPLDEKGKPLRKHFPRGIFEKEKYVTNNNQFIEIFGGWGVGNE